MWKAACTALDSKATCTVIGDSSRVVEAEKSLEVACTVIQGFGVAIEPELEPVRNTGCAALDHTSTLSNLSVCTVVEDIRTAIEPDRESVWKGARTIMQDHTAPVETIRNAASASSPQEKAELSEVASGTLQQEMEAALR